MVTKRAMDEWKPASVLVYGVVTCWECAYPFAAALQCTSTTLLWRVIMDLLLASVRYPSLSADERIKYFRLCTASAVPSPAGWLSNRSYVSGGHSSAAKMT